MECEEAMLIKVIYPCKLIFPSSALIVSRGTGSETSGCSRDLAKIYLMVVLLI